MNNDLSRSLIAGLSRRGLRFVVHGSTQGALLPWRKSRVPNDLDLVICPRDLSLFVRVISELTPLESALSWQDEIELVRLRDNTFCREFVERSRQRFYLRLMGQDLQIDLTYSGIVFKNHQHRFTPLRITNVS